MPYAVTKQLHTQQSKQKTTLSICLTENYRKYFRELFMVNRHKLKGIINLSVKDRIILICADNN